MMDRKRRDHRVHEPPHGERPSEVVLAQFDQPLVGKALAGVGEHRLREIDAERPGVGMLLADETDQPPVARAEVDEALQADR
jgi:hypothetical protein